MGHLSLRIRMKDWILRKFGGIIQDDKRLDYVGN